MKDKAATCSFSGLIRRAPPILTRGPLAIFALNLLFILLLLLHSVQYTVQQFARRLYIPHFRRALPRSTGRGCALNIERNFLLPALEKRDVLYKINKNWSNCDHHMLGPRQCLNTSRHVACVKATTYFKAFANS